MIAGWTNGARARRIAGHNLTRMTRLTAAGLLAGVGLIGQAAPAGAAVDCNYVEGTDVARLTLQRRDAMTIGLDATGHFTVTDGASTDLCGAEVTVETVHGNVRVVGGSGAISVRSVEGTINVEKATGKVQATTVN